jgi:hypothetical protein
MKAIRKPYEIEFCGVALKTFASVLDPDMHPKL